MNNVYLVIMEEGSYDDYCKEVVAACSTVEQAEAMIVAIWKELESMWVIPTPTERFASMSPAARENGVIGRLYKEYDEEINSVAKVWPLDRIGMPSKDNHNAGELEFEVQVLPLG